MNKFPIRSTYRLFLRAISAAMLHHSTATRNVRKLYRPVFDEAAEVEVRASTTRVPETRQLLDRWLVNWNETMDNTLELLHNSATHRGLPHRLTRNMSYLTDTCLKSRVRKAERTWDPQLPLSSPVYSVKPKKAPQKKQKDKDAFDAAVFQAVGQVVRLAEGRSDLSLGRLPIVR